MCGIICYLGERQAIPILLDGLRRLEYRGYDSSGLAVFENNSVRSERSVGKIKALEEKLRGRRWLAQGGIAHTRWATHGIPSLENAHPQKDDTESVYVIHNGIVENYKSLKQELIEKGHKFSSETDTEVLAHLIRENFNGNLETAVSRALRRVQGTFGIGVMSVDEPGKIVVARRGSPLILGVRSNEVFAASDVSALVTHTKSVIYLQDDDLVVMRPGEYHIQNIYDQDVAREAQTVDWDVGSAEKKGFEHFMLKEIFEQPEAIENAIRGRIVDSEGISKLGGLEAVQKEVLSMDRLIIVSCGTSYYAGLLSRYLMESCSDVGVDVDLASEFRYRSLNLNPGTVVLAISQSGETADTLAAVREAQRKGIPVLGLVNVVGSNIARETDAGVYNHAGPEIGVASTKAFSSQVTVLYLIALLIARHQRMSYTEGQAFIRALREIPGKVQQILEQASHIETIAKKYAHFGSFLFVGRKFSYPVALEGALKLKEVSYLHAEGYAAGEMKHGPIALIDKQFPSICIAPKDSVYEKMLSNIQELKARSGPILAIANADSPELEELSDDLIQVPESPEWFTPFLTVVPLQLLAYYIARERGCAIDQPRNLAKSVTVE